MPSPTRLLALPALAGLLAVGLVAGCGSGPAPALPVETAASPGVIRFDPMPGGERLPFKHVDGSTGRRYFVEVMGPGAGLIDYDDDGDLDLYLVNGGTLPGYRGPTPRNALFRNDGGRFTDVTAFAGVGGPGYGIGCCAGDFDPDGHVDLYVTRFGRNALYRNLGDGRFADVTERAGVAAGGFSAGAAFCDYDRDGLLDLYVCRYVRYDPLTSPECVFRLDGEKRRRYCLPTAYPPASGILYRNLGGGRFRDVTRAAGMAVPPGRSLGCVWLDYDDDGWPDLYVANDMSENFLFRNEQGRRFTEVGFAAGVALAGSGRPQAGMGVAAADFNRDGRLDLVVTNFTGEYAALYRNEGGGQFSDVSAQVGLVEPTRPYTGFGVGAPDLDLDGAPDLLVVNGHVTEDVERFYAGLSLAQPGVVARGEGGAFIPVAHPGEELVRPRVRRGAAFGDVDNDGRVDVLLANWREEPSLLRNSGVYSGHYLILRLRGTRSNRSAIGARVTVRAGRMVQVDEVRSGGSYCSQSDLRLHFGLGGAEQADEVAVRWPSGRTEIRRNLKADRIVEWTEGESP